MTEMLDPWPFVVTAYVLGLGGTLALIGWCHAAMRRAERRRDEVKRR